MRERADDEKCFPCESLILVNICNRRTGLSNAMERLLLLISVDFKHILNGI